MSEENPKKTKPWNYCIACGSCAAMCPRQAEGAWKTAEGVQQALVRYLRGKGTLTDEVRERALGCRNCGACADVVCPMRLDPLDLLSSARRKIAKEEGAE